MSIMEYYVISVKATPTDLNPTQKIVTVVFGS
jgi:hypothetical protein